MPVHEWSVMITDLILAAFCLEFAYRIGQKAHPILKAPKLIANGLRLCALSAFIGGIRHGFSPEMSINMRIAIWYSTYVLIMATSAMILCGVLRSLARNSEHRWSYWLMCGSKLVVASLFFLISGEVSIISWSCGIDTLCIIGLGLMTARCWEVQRKNTGLWLLCGGGIVLIAGLIQGGWLVGTKGTLHNNACHILLIPAMYAYYRAALVFRESQ